jgi:uncharacterized paraquat-inducible protein A
MRHLLVVCTLGLMLSASSGCSWWNKMTGKDDDSSSQKMSADGCPHCTGVQTLNADGTCPKCGMSMKK